MIYSISTSWKKKKKLVEEQQSARRSPRPESGLRSLAKSYDFTSLGSPPRVVDLSSYSPSPLPSASFPAARAFVMEALHHGAKAELMTDVEERPWKRPRFQQWLRGPRRIPGRVRPGGSASDNKGFISLSGGSGSRAGRGVDVSHARSKPPPPPLLPPSRKRNFCFRSRPHPPPSSSEELRLEQRFRIFLSFHSSTFVGGIFSSKRVLIHVHCHACF